MCFCVNDNCGWAYANWWASATSIRLKNHPAMSVRFFHVHDSIDIVVGLSIRKTGKDEVVDLRAHSADGAKPAISRHHRWRAVGNRCREPNTSLPTTDGAVREERPSDPAFIGVKYRLGVVRARPARSLTRAVDGQALEAVCGSIDAFLTLFCHSAS